MLVRPGGVASLGLNDFEDGVALDRIVRIQRDTLTLCVDMPGQGSWINDVQRNGRITRVLVNAFVKHLDVTRLPRASRVRRVENAAVVANVIEQPVADG